MKKIFILFLLSIFLYASNCYEQTFNIRSTEGSKLIDFIEQITELCELNLIIDNSVSDEILQQKLKRIYLKKKKFSEILNLFLSEHNLFYSLSDDILRISYIATKTYHIDYLASERNGATTTEVSVGSGGSGGGGDDGDSSGSSGGSTNVGTKIETTMTFNFWQNLEDEIAQILTRPEDRYTAGTPIINEKAGLVTVSGTLNQLKRVEKYLNEIEEKLKKQVLIDVNILSVNLKNSNLTGIDWGEFYKQLTSDGSVPVSNIPSNIVTTASVEQILEFLKQKGEVVSISNPKIVALNNQPALISVGNEYFYSIKETQIAETDGGTANTFNSTKIESVFAGILLDITAEISQDNKITLSINPSISQTVQTISTEVERAVPPDLTKKQLSSVIITESGKRVILGGLITKSKTTEKTVVPLLGYVPVIGSMFRSEKNIENYEELVIIVTPYIIDHTKDIDLKKYKYIQEVNQSL
jgi:general secretion pathway protein D